MTVQLDYPTAELLPADCIVLAAGLSSRMGEWKMNLPLPAAPGDLPGTARTILDHSIDNALTACERVILVTGHRGDELAARYQGRADILVVHNPDFKKGMKSSLLCGLAQVTTDYAFITHGDLPFLSSSLFSNIWKARGEQPVFPVYEKQHGHPVLISKRVSKKVIQSLTNSSYSQSIKTTLRKDCFDLDINCRDILRDIDTPAAYYIETGVQIN